MRKYKLVACDLDRTLISTDMSLSEKNRKAIREFGEQGVFFVPCTGRTLCEMSDIVNNPDIRYYIYSNGAGIWDKKTNEYTLSCLSDTASRAVLDILSSMDVYIVIHHGGKTYSDAKAVSRGMDEYNVSFNVDELIRGFSSIEQDLIGLAYSMKDIESICVFFKSAEEAERCRAVLETNEELLIVRGWSYNFEIFSKDGGKGPALKRLADKLGVSISETIAVGDSDNDTSMIRAAGLGLAASNACKELREIADEVICSNDEDVADFILNKWIIGE